MTIAGIQVALLQYLEKTAVDLTGRRQEYTEGTPAPTPPVRRHRKLWFTPNLAWQSSRQMSALSVHQDAGRERGKKPWALALALLVTACSPSMQGQLHFINPSQKELLVVVCSDISSDCIHKSVPPHSTKSDTVVAGNHSISVFSGDKKLWLRLHQVIASNLLPHYIDLVGESQWVVVDISDRYRGNTGYEEERRQKALSRSSRIVQVFPPGAMFVWQPSRGSSYAARVLPYAPLPDKQRLLDSVVTLIPAPKELAGDALTNYVNDQAARM